MFTFCYVVCSNDHNAVLILKHNTLPYQQCPALCNASAHQNESAQPTSHRSTASPTPEITPNNDKHEKKKKHEQHTNNNNKLMEKFHVKCALNHKMCSLTCSLLHHQIKKTVKMCIL